MTNRDYANRKPKKRAPQKRGARKAAPPARRLPIVLLLIVVLVAIAGFGYFLWNIKDSSTSDQAETGSTETKASQVETKAATKPKPQGDLPPKPKEEWTYLEELKNKKVEVELPQTDNKPKRPYLMQCGSFRTESQANKRKAVIAFQGLEAQVRKSIGSKGTWYRVVMGPYDRKRIAERHRHVLQKVGLNDCKIWYWEG